MQSTCTVGLPEEMAIRLRLVAKERAVSRNALIREGIEYVLKKYEHV